MNRAEWLIINEMERKREIMSYYAKVRSFVIGNTIPTIIAYTDDGGNVTDIERRYPPEIEKLILQLEKEEEKALEGVKSVNFVGW